MERVYKRVGNAYDYMEAMSDYITIVRREVKIFGGDRVSEMTVFYSDITSVAYKPSRLFECGYLEIRCAGNTYDPEKDYKGKYIDPYCITFADKKIEADAKEFKKYVENRMSIEKNKPRI